MSSCTLSQLNQSTISNRIQQKNTAKNAFQGSENDSIKDCLRARDRPKCTDNKPSSTDNLLQQVLDKLDEQKEGIQDLKNELRDHRKIVETPGAEDFETKDAQWDEEREFLHRHIVYLEQREEIRTKQDERNGIVIRGLELESADSKCEVCDLLQEKLQVNANIEVNTIHVSRSNKLVIAKFANFDEKIRILKSEKNLKDTQIFITSDRTKKETHTDSFRE
ncbi:hypothetical protein QAD02_021302 [Eretmocerus hayati]|uniref:Uncharacterized protein n=1 Tax=Eretmocerus hayati TaxID=131215 RepID=A0ACC2PPI8_9HYME|nr:hypothetical protein QAD02_021302 [Eretmocerus hayati]